MITSYLENEFRKDNEGKNKWHKYEKYLDSNFLKTLYYTVRLKCGDIFEKMHDLIGEYLIEKL